MSHDAQVIALGAAVDGAFASIVKHWEVNTTATWPSPPDHLTQASTPVVGYITQRVFHYQRWAVDEVDDVGDVDDDVVVVDDVVVDDVVVDDVDVAVDVVVYVVVVVDDDDDDDDDEDEDDEDD